MPDEQRKDEELEVEGHIDEAPADDDDDVEGHMRLSNARME